MDSNSGYGKLLMHSTPKIVVKDGYFVGERDNYGMNQMEQGETLMGRILEEVSGLKTLPAIISKLQEASSRIQGLNYINHLLGVTQIKVDGNFVMSGIPGIRQLSIPGRRLLQSTLSIRAVRFLYAAHARRNR